MSATRLFLIRHGQVEGFQQKRYNGHSNVPLTDHGRRQLAHIRDQLEAQPLQAIYSSDLDRSRYGAELLAEARGLSVNQRPSLRELDIGDWEGHTWQELMDKYPEAWAERLNDLVNYRVPGGESLLDAAVRVRQAVTELLQRHAGGQIALVAHGGVNRIVLLDAIGAPLEQMFSIEQDYGCLNVIDYFADGNSVVRLLNATQLPEALCAP